MKCRYVPYQDPDYAACIALRSRILRLPLGLSFDEDELQMEKDQFTLAGFNENGEVVAVLMLKELNPTLVKMRQVAVLEEAQGQGYGRQIVAFGIAFAKEKTYTQMELNARTVALNFWNKLGFKQDSLEFEEVGIPHVKMIMNLEQP